MENDYLAHHGVKGMKWGVRRTPEQLGHPKADGKTMRRVKNDYDSSSKQPSKQKQGMSTAKKVAIGAAVVGGTALAAYGASRYVNAVKDDNFSYHMARGRALSTAYLSKNTFRDMAAYNSGDWRRDARLEKLEGKTMQRIYDSEARAAGKDSFRTARRNAKDYRKLTKENPYSDPGRIMYEKRYRDRYAYNVPRSK